MLPSSPRRYPLSSSIALFLAALAAPFAPAPAHAATYLWDANLGTPNAQDGSGVWDTVTNQWITAGANAIWSNANDANFGAGIDGTYTLDLTFNPSATSLIFNNSGYTLTSATAQTLTVSSVTSSISLAAGKTATIGANVTVVSSTTATNSAIIGAGTLIIENGGVVKNGATGNANVLAINATPTDLTTVEVRAGGSLLTSPVTGQVNGNAIFVNGALNVTGGLVEALGTLGIGQSTTAGVLPGVVTITDGTVKATSSNGIRFGGTSATTSPGGTVNLNGGVLQVEKIFRGGGAVTLAEFNFNGGTVLADASLTPPAAFMDGLTRANIRDGGAIIDTNAKNILISQALEHSDKAGDNPIDGGLTKNGQGTLALTGANTYNGPTNVNAGAVRLGNSAALGASTLISPNSGIQIIVSNSITVDNQVRLFGAGLNNDGVLKSQDGFNTLTNFGVSGGGGTRLNIVAGSTLELPNSILLGDSGSMQNLRAIGTGVLILGGDNSTVLGGGQSFLLGSGLAQGPTVQVGHDQAFGFGTIDFQPGALSTVAGSNAIARTLSNNLKFSDVTLNQATFGAAGTGDLTFLGTATMNGNTEITVQNAATTLSGSLNGIAALTKFGPGTLILDGIDPNPFTGGTFVSEGVLDVKKAGGLGIGDVSVLSGATLKLELAVGNDYLSDSGNLLLAAGNPLVQLAFTGTPDVIAGLSFDGGLTFAAAGTWGSPTSGAQFTSPLFSGPGTLNVVIPEPGSAALLIACAGLLGLRRRR